MIASSTQWMDQPLTTDYKISICCFSVKPVVLSVKTGDGLPWNLTEDYYIYLSV